MRCEDGDGYEVGVCSVSHMKIEVLPWMMALPVYLSIKKVTGTGTTRNWLILLCIKKDFNTDSLALRGGMALCNLQRAFCFLL